MPDPEAKTKKPKPPKNEAKDVIAPDAKAANGKAPLTPTQEARAKHIAEVAAPIAAGFVKNFHVANPVDTASKAVSVAYAVIEEAEKVAKARGS